MKAIFLVLFISGFQFVFSQQYDDKTKSLLIALNPERSQSEVAPDLKNYQANSHQDADLYDPKDSIFWKKNHNKSLKDSLRIPNTVFQTNCVDCIETHPGMYQFQVAIGLENYRMTFHREMQANLFRFTLMNELGFILPAQSYLPQARIDFKDESEKKIFKENVLSHMGYDRNFKWSRWIKDEGENWVVVKSVLVEKDSSSTELAEHWINLSKEKIDSYRSLRGLFVLLLLTDWGEDLNISADQFIRKQRGYIFIKHPLNYLFEGVHISDLKWMGRMILELDRTSWDRAINSMNLGEHEKIIVRDKVLALLNYFKTLFFTKDEQQDFPEQPTSYIIDKSVTIPALKQNWRYYVMLGFNRLIGDAALREASKHASLEWNKRIKTFKQGDSKLLDQLVRGSSSHDVVPLSVSAFAKVGLIARYSRDIVRGQYYGNTHLANLADTMRYGAYGTMGFHADVLQKVPLSLYLRANWEQSIIHLQPVASLDDAIKLFWRDPVLPKKVLKWKKFFNTKSCKYKNGEIQNREDCQTINDSLSSFAAEFKIDETIIFKTDLTFTQGASLGVPAIDVLYGINPFSGSRFGVEKGRVNGKRLSLVRTASGIRIIITKNKNPFKRWNFDIKYGVTLFEYQNNKDEGEPVTEVYDLDYQTFDDEKKMYAFLALKGLFNGGDTSFIERFFEKEVIKNELRAHKVLVHDIPGPLPHKKDKVDLSNRVELNLFENGQKRELVLFKTIKRKYWDWLGLVEDMINFLLPVGRVNLRSVHDGENAGNLRRDAKIDMIVSEAEITQKGRGVFEPLIILNHKDIDWKATRERIERKLEKLQDDYLGVYSKDEFEKLTVSHIEMIKQFELNEIIVLRSSLIKKWINYFSGREIGIDLEKESGIPGRWLAKLRRMSARYDLLKIESQLKFSHDIASFLLSKYSMSEMIQLFNKDDIYHDIQMNGWAYKKDNDIPFYLSSGMSEKQENFESVFGQIIKELGLPEYEVNGNFIAPGF